jgi:integrase
MNAVKERERVLSDIEIREIWTATGQLVSVFCPFTRLLLLTGQRRTEVSEMSWSEIGGPDDAVWTIPAARTKNGIAHEVPLSPAALAVLRGIPRLGPFVFTTDSETPISGFSKFKSSLDKTILTLRLKAASKMKDSEKVARPPERWTFHDLRRTAATIMAKRGVSPHVVERLLNHVSGTISGVAKIYNRHEYWAERCAAVETLGDYVSQIVKL